MLTPLSVGAILEVDVLPGPPPVLVVRTAAGQVAGSLTFVGYLDLIDCIQQRGVTYQATIMNIAGGVYEVRVDAI